MSDYLKSLTLKGLKVLKNCAAQMAALDAAGQLYRDNSAEARADRPPFLLDPPE